jgi:hypothetical protein
MIRIPRRAALLASATAALAGALPASAALAATHTDTLNIAAELVQQPPGKPWVVNLGLGADLKMDDGSTPVPLDHMKFSFTKGAKVHGEAFATCTAEIIQKSGPEACPARSKLGEGTGNAHALELDFPAQVQVFNGPGNASVRKIFVYARAIDTVTVLLTGTLKRTPGKFGYVLDMPVPPIPTVGASDNNASITKFDVKVGGWGRVKGKRTPFIEAPTKCTAPGWPFLGEFHYVDGTSSSSSALIGCTLHAVNTNG